jgi:hypothetical protein
LPLKHDKLLELIRGYKAEVAAINVAGELSDEELDAWMDRADAILIEAVRLPVLTAASAVAVIALGAVGISIILFTLGSGLGLSTVSPWSFSNPSPTTFGLVAAVWLIITQWLASALGGYLAGRLRTKWVGIRTDEVFFRDLLTASLLGLSRRYWWRHFSDWLPQR